VSDSERVWLALGAVVLLVLGLAPPLTTWARHYEFVEALQFSVFAMVVPALLTCGAPWRFLRLAGTEGTGAGRAMDRLAAGPPGVREGVHPLAPVRRSDRGLEDASSG
jgi:hypothetical protein